MLFDIIKANNLQEVDHNRQAFLIDQRSENPKLCIGNIPSDDVDCRGGRLHYDGEAANSQTSSQPDHPSIASQVISCSSQVPDSQHSTRSIADDKAPDEITGEWKSFD
ncbi:hypothetical protein QAD02_013377 [Eretmocerus hayati]|uniref:Uncharacterized protein n=1 Tax=Eretmocerus hayati TaxID=131215 RepID=A0ACC2P1Z3_9HYME|nr:hypothetical protein QAD02_013377 [Eretmocerus hayati]